jgi:hypothetical protein
MYIQAKYVSLQTCFLLIINDFFSSLQDESTDYESPTLGAHTHAHAHSMGGHVWAWVGIGPC